jgi:hypothetical protein
MGVLLPIAHELKKVSVWVPHVDAGSGGTAAAHSLDGSLDDLGPGMVEQHLQ